MPRATLGVTFVDPRNPRGKGFLMTQPAIFDSKHAHVPHCECEQCLNPSDQHAEPVARRALCDGCRPGNRQTTLCGFRPLRLRCEACGVVGTQGAGIEAVS